MSTETETKQPNPTRYRKKPVVIEAICYDGSIDSADEIIAWTARSTTPAFEEYPDAVAVDRANIEQIGLIYPRPIEPERRVLRVRTLESGAGSHIVDVDDWVIRGVQGEHYPCKPAIFYASYEPALDGSLPVATDHGERDALIADLSRMTRLHELAQRAMLSANQTSRDIAELATAYFDAKEPLEVVADAARGLRKHAAKFFLDGSIIDQRAHSAWRYLMLKLDALIDE